MADAMEMMILSILAPQLHCEWQLPSWQVALLTSVGDLGRQQQLSRWVQFRSPGVVCGWPPPPAAASRSAEKNETLCMETL